MNIDPAAAAGALPAPLDSSLRAAVDAYVAAVVDTCAPPHGTLVSLILFGSAATGGYAANISDVDLLLVLADDADPAARRRVSDTVTALEERHGLGRPRRSHQGRLVSAVEAFADRISANVRAFFVCARADLLSGEPGRILGIPAAQAVFVDRVAIPSIVASGRTVWGEDLLGDVPLPPIRRRDVAKAFFGLFNQVLFAAAMYPLLPGATKYAMDALKRSIHNCYFCYQSRAEPLETEIAFFQGRHGTRSALSRLSALRRGYRPSFTFVLACLPTLAGLHLRTVRGLQFPRAAR